MVWPSVVTYWVRYVRCPPKVSAHSALAAITRWCQCGVA